MSPNSSKVLSARSLDKTRSRCTPSRQNSISYFISSTTTDSASRRGPSINYLDVKTLTTKDQIDDMAHRPRTAPVHCIEKRSFNSLHTRTSELSARCSNKTQRICTRIERYLSLIHI